MAATSVLRTGTRPHGTAERWPGSGEARRTARAGFILLLFSSWWKEKRFTLLQMEFSTCSGRPGAPGPPSCTRLGTLPLLGYLSQTLQQEHVPHTVRGKGHRKASKKTVQDSDGSRSHLERLVAMQQAGPVSPTDPGLSAHLLCAADSLCASLGPQEAALDLGVTPPGVRSQTASPGPRT